MTVLTLLDAATFKQSGGTSFVIGGGAKKASDKGVPV